jgi:hypothetical protein
MNNLKVWYRNLSILVLVCLLFGGCKEAKHAVIGGSITEPIPDYTTLAIALRHNGLTQGQRQEIINNARKYLGRPYDKIGAAGSGVNGTRGIMISLAGA